MLAYLPLQALRIETRPTTTSILQCPREDVQTRSYTRPLGSSLGQRLGREGGQGEDLEQLADGGRNGEPAGARRGAGHVAEREVRGLILQIPRRGV